MCRLHTFHKLLGDNTRENLDDLGFDDDFSDIATKAQFMKGRADNLNLIII